MVSLGGIVRKNTAENGEKSMTSKTAIYHEKYSEKTLANDIAVIKLPQNVALGETFFIEVNFQWVSLLS